jgi:hypothetical protein
MGSNAASGNIAMYEVEVNYDLTVDEAVEAGRYSWSYDRIPTENLTNTRSGKATVEVGLVHFGRIMSNDDILAELDAQGWRPAELHELLALGATHMELQIEFPIVALGSIWLEFDEFRTVASLFSRGPERALGPASPDRSFSEICRFAAVRK